MNAITSLLQHLERLIVEHGSASIQEKQIAFLKDQFSILSSQLTNFKSENRDLKLKIQNLRQKANESQATIEKLNQELFHKNLPPASASSAEEQEPESLHKKIRTWKRQLR